MARQRVWLERWEWSCCGDPFRAGDAVTLMVDRPISGPLVELLGPDLAGTVDAVESHHEDGGATRLTGSVQAIKGVFIEHVERRVPRERPAFADDAAPREYRSPDGWIARSVADTAYVIVSEPVPGTAQLHEISRVPWPPRENEPVAAPEGPVPHFTGYLVDLAVG